MDGRWRSIYTILKIAITSWMWGVQTDIQHFSKRRFGFAFAAYVRYVRSVSSLQYSLLHFFLITKISECVFIGFRFSALFHPISPQTKKTKLTLMLCLRIKTENIIISGEVTDSSCLTNSVLGSSGICFQCHILYKWGLNGTHMQTHSKRTPFGMH